MQPRAQRWSWSGAFSEVLIMFVCVCKAVSDSTIRRQVEAGARRVADLSRETGLGTCCGKCVPAARQLIEEAAGQVPQVGRWVPEQVRAKRV